MLCLTHHIAMVMDPKRIAWCVCNCAVALSSCMLSVPADEEQQSVSHSTASNVFTFWLKPFKTTTMRASDEQKTVKC